MLIKEKQNPLILNIFKSVFFHISIYWCEKISTFHLILFFHIIISDSPTLGNLILPLLHWTHVPYPIKSNFTFYITKHPNVYM